MSGPGMSHVTSHIRELLLLPRETIAPRSVFQVNVLLATPHLTLAAPEQPFIGENWIDLHGGLVKVMR